jgi:hypothetical protein
LKRHKITPFLQAGSVIRLKQAFRPRPHSQAAYWHGIIAGVAAPDLLNEPEQLCEVVVQLYDPISRQIYTDQSGAKALYSFYMDEIELTEF